MLKPIFDIHKYQICYITIFSISRNIFLCFPVCHYDRNKKGYSKSKVEVEVGQVLDKGRSTWGLEWVQGFILNALKRRMLISPPVNKEPILKHEISLNVTS
jgi:hypothetical protein